MANELERLRADLEAIQRHLRGYGCMPEVVAGIKAQIARLEAEQADPWRDVMDHLEVARSGRGISSIGLNRLVAYYDHLTAENADLKQKYDLANLTIKAATDRLNEAKAEVARLTARVAELENDPEPARVVLRRAEEVKIGDVILAGGYTQTVTAIETETTQRIIKCDGWMAWFRNRELVAVINGDSNPGDPILDPARVLATAEELMWGPTVYAMMLKPKNAKPYRLKGVENGG